MLSAAMLLAGTMLCGTNASAQPSNVLANPGAENDSFSPWTEYNNVGYNFAVVSVTSHKSNPTHGGSYMWEIFGDYNAPTTYCGIYQVLPAFPGQKFTADGWVLQDDNDNFTGDGNNAFLEVTFQDIGGNPIGRYRSGSVVSGFPADTWVDLAVTNQLDPNTYATIGSVTNLVAPPGTVKVEYNVVFNLVNYGGGSTYWDDLELLTSAPPPPYITNVAPAGVTLATNQNLTFTAISQAGVITNIQVTVTATTGMVNPTTTTTTYGTNTPGLTLTGLGTATVNGSLALSSNTTYTVAILANDTTGALGTASDNFDTIRPVLVWEAEDFNYNGGQFIDTGVDGGTWLYQNLVGTQGVDENKIGGPGANGGGNYHFYRPTDAVSIQGAYEQPRQKFLDAAAAGNTNEIDEEVGYNSPGDWLDYTRTFPQGNYNVYARLATVGSGTMLNFGQVLGNDPNNQTVTNLGTFSFTDNGWNTYQYVPLKDSFGNLVSVSLKGVATFRSTVVGNPNINFYMIVPAVGSQNPALIQSYPTGLHPFEPTNKFSFTVGPASGSTINSNAIHLSLNGIDFTSQLAITAGPTNTWNCTLPIALNEQYLAVINVTNTTSLSSKFTINFDTFSQTNFMWEAEDFDFNGGQFIDNPVPTGDNTLSGTGASAVANGSPAANSYFFYPAGDTANAAIYGVDITTQGSADNSDHYYRPFEDCGTELNFDYLRQKFIDAQNSTGDPNIGDFDVGWFNGGWWLNYTRTYPTGSYYVFGRLAGGNGAFSGTTLSQVTGGWGTTNQTTQMLGSFADPNAAGWQTWHWVPMIDANNRPAIISLGGTNTLKLTSGGNLNANYFMLVTAAPPLTVQATTSNQHPALSVPTKAGFNYIVLYKNNLSDPAWNVLTIVVGDGTVKSVTDSTGGAQRFYKVLVQ